MERGKIEPMSELALAIWAMKAAHHQWPVMPTQLEATVKPVVAVERPLTAAQVAERNLLRKRLESLTPCLTGRLVKQTDSPVYVPAMDEACVERALVAEKR